MNRASNPYRDAARLKKASALLTMIDRLRGGISHELTLAYWESAADESWRRLALNAGCHIPSADTRALVLSILGDRCLDPFRRVAS